MPPVPPDAKVILPALACASAMNSFTVVALIDGRITSARGTAITSVMKVKSRTGSYGISFLTDGMIEKPSSTVAIV